jgi:tRNA 2-thiouridine synthesizing protein A
MTRHRLDTRGSLCPRPIIDLAVLARGAAAGDTIEVLNDDAAFPFDVRAWCEGSGHELVQLSTQGQVHRAEIRVRSRS